ncbi:MAG: chitin deacetylase [Tremellales sp. Tagirdzhanova-0007]|nr:MAG: chitin deacetylase [Tremellales sp. Tagirdzhanova-0007]
MTKTLTILLSLLATALAQSSTGVQQALTATTQIANSINTGLPQTATTGPQGFPIPALSLLTSDAATDSTVALDSTYTQGAQPTKVSGAPALPNPTLVIANYPSLDLIPSTTSPQVQQWISEIDMSKVPDYNITDGTCSGTPGAITDGRCWWTCGGCTRATDITECPDKYTWGLSYDDGPSPFTPLLLDYLDQQNVTTTFFVVGSRVLSRPQMLQSEYMAGHQISVHTWSHPYLTKLTNEEIVAELGWTKQVIKDTIGVTPNTFRPPYGDIDDRVRAIAAQMGLTPIIWTSITANGTTTDFDTTDWNIPGGEATGESSLTKFEEILDVYVPELTSGFIVLEHDLYQQTVDLAVGYVLPMAIASGKFQLKSIISCLGFSNAEAYIETASNSTTTAITSAASTFFQASIGTATGSVAVATSTNVMSISSSPSASVGAEAVSTSSSSKSGSSSASSSTAHATSSKAAAGRGVEMRGVIPMLIALLCVGIGMGLVA